LWGKKGNQNYGNITNNYPNKGKPGKRPKCGQGKTWKKFYQRVKEEHREILTKY